MQYKTIALELIKSRQQVHEQLRLNRQLLAAVTMCGLTLKTAHQHWIHRLTENQPQTADPLVIAQAMEMATAELDSLLPSVLAEGESLEMAIARRRTRQD